MKKTLRVILNSRILFVTTFTLIMMVSNLQAKEFAYQGEIEGMVCAFCVYNVSNQIRELPGVQMDSVNIELQSGKVEFLSNQLVSQKVVAKLFEDSGFKLVSLIKINHHALANNIFSETAKLSIHFPTNELPSMNDLLSELGDLAEKQISFVIVKAPKSIEMNILKPIIAGRQQTIKVKFTAIQSKQVDISLYFKANSHLAINAIEQHSK